MLRSLFALVTSAGLALGASLQQVTNFGENPTGLQMYLYVPDKVAEKPAIIVAVSNKSKRFLQIYINPSRSYTRAAAPRRPGILEPSYPHTRIRTVSFSSTLELPI